VSKSGKKSRLERWFHGENESFNAEFIRNKIQVKGMAISVQNYKIIQFSGLPF
jgi:hypothetical protein